LFCRNKVVALHLSFFLKKQRNESWHDFRCHEESGIPDRKVGHRKKEALMKRIEAIIRPTKVGKVCIALENAGHPGLTFSLIESRESMEGQKYQLRGRTYKVDLVSRARVGVIVKDTDVDRIVETIRDAAFTGEKGDGEIYVHSMEDIIRIRTGESGEAAA
jgi:nitrogen regulatory protein P-II 1